MIPCRCTTLCTHLFAINFRQKNGALQPPDVSYTSLLWSGFSTLKSSDLVIRQPPRTSVLLAFCRKARKPEDTDHPPQPASPYEDL
jgi:hypothetical protein